MSASQRATAYPPRGVSSAQKDTTTAWRGYNCTMSSKLSTANPYLRDPVVRQRSVLTSVSSSSAIEGIHAPFKQATVTRTSGGKASTSASTTDQGRLTRAKP
jgi:hypothetical protein